MMDPRTIEKFGNQTEDEQFRSLERDRSYQIEKIRNDLIDKYNNHYHHWKDFNWLVTFLAMLGLALSIYDYEICFTAKT